MNKLIVVSGGSEGIGLSIVEIFMKNGFDAAICARNLQKLIETKRKLTEKYPNQNAHIFQADLSKKNECLLFADFVNKLPNKISVLVNNTGTYMPGQIHAEAEGQLETMIETNLYSAYYLTRGIVNQMIGENKGHIFNICSVASVIPYPNGGSYSISKYAMYGMTKVLREELKPLGIKVTAVLPGATRTASWDGIAETLPEDRLMDPADVAEMVYSTFSLSPKSVVEEILIRPQLGDL
jgi:short-subunit dehydrogenase